MIIVVDDEKDIRELIGEGLRRLGHAVCEADSGQEAIKLIRSHKVKLLVTDIRMPNGDGISLLKEIRKEDLTYFPVVVMTGFSDVCPEEIYELGAKHILLKPFRLKEFIAIVDAYLK